MVKHLLSTVAAIGLASGCGKTSDGHKNESPRTSKNTLSADDVHSKLSRGSAVFDELQNLKSKFKGGTPKKFLSPFDLQSSLSDEGGEDRSLGRDDEADGYLPSTTSPQTCEDAFKSFDSSYAQAQKEFNHLVTLIKNPNGDPDPVRGTQWVKVNPAEDEALAYDLVEKEKTQGLSIKGHLGSGGTGDDVFIKSSVDMTMNTSFRMPTPGEDNTPTPPSTDRQGSTPMVETFKGDLRFDLNDVKKEVTFTANLNQIATHGNDKNGLNVGGTVHLYGGSEKMVRHQLNIEIVGRQPQTIKTDITAKVVDESTIAVSGTITGPNMPGTLNYRVVKDSAGRCTVQR